MENRKVICLILSLGLLFGGIFVSCSPRILENVITKIEYKDRVQKDSVFIRDSIFQKEYIKGDTVYLDKYIHKYIYRDKYKTDSVFIAVHDTTIVEKLVEKQLTPMQKAKQDAFWGLILALVLALLWILRKPIGKLLGI